MTHSILNPFPGLRSGSLGGMLDHLQLRHIVGLLDDPGMGASTGENYFHRLRFIVQQCQKGVHGEQTLGDAVIDLIQHHQIEGTLQDAPAQRFEIPLHLRRKLLHMDGRIESRVNLLETVNLDPGEQLVGQQDFSGSFTPALQKLRQEDLFVTARGPHGQPEGGGCLPFAIARIDVNQPGHAAALLNADLSKPLQLGQARNFMNDPFKLAQRKGCVKAFLTMFSWRAE